MLSRASSYQAWILFMFLPMCNWLDRLHGGEPIRVMTFNIRFDTDADGENAWRHRRAWVAELIRANLVDVVGLQEVLISQMQDLQQSLPQYESFGVGRDDGREGGEHGPIFYRRDRFQEQDRGAYWLSEKPEEPGRTDWQAACPRMVTWMNLISNDRQLRFTFINTHFDHVSEKARLESARLIQQRLPSGNSPVILAGDFNCRMDTPPLRWLTQAKSPTNRRLLHDALALAGDRVFGPDSTWNGFREIEPGQRIDFILVSNDWQVLEHRILDERRDGRFPSDHLPVLVTLLPAER